MPMNPCDCGNHFWKPLTKGYVTLVSPEDKHLLILRWRTLIGADPGIVYAVTSGWLSLHRLILKPEKGYQVDHINGYGLDNRRDNLRPCLDFQNQGNRVRRTKKQKTSQFRGVSYHKNKQKWVAKISIKRKKKYLGAFKLERDAALTYDNAAKKHFGEFARLNFP
jgi:hypothetical protein